MPYLVSALDPPYISLYQLRDSRCKIWILYQGSSEWLFFSACTPTDNKYMYVQQTYQWWQKELCGNNQQYPLRSKNSHFFSIIVLLQHPFLLEYAKQLEKLSHTFSIIGEKSISGHFYISVQYFHKLTVFKSKVHKRTYEHIHFWTRQLCNDHWIRHKRIDEPY